MWWSQYYLMTLGFSVDVSGCQLMHFSIVGQEEKGDCFKIVVPQFF
jgi:hypothetical protein